MPRKSPSPGDLLLNKLALLKSAVAPDATDASMTEELLKENFYRGYQLGVQDALEIFKLLIKEEKEVT